MKFKLNFNISAFVVPNYVFYFHSLSVELNTLYFCWCLIQKARVKWLRIWWLVCLRVKKRRGRVGTKFIVDEMGYGKRLVQSKKILKDAEQFFGIQSIDCYYKNWWLSVFYLVLIVIHIIIVQASKQRNGIATCNVKNLVWNASGNVVHLVVLSLNDLVYVAACIRQWILFGKKKSSYVLIWIHDSVHTWYVYQETVYLL